MKFVSKKVNHIRKQNWSAPAIMSFFIVCCMIVIYGVESMGLANKEKNLEYRSTAPEIVIKKISESKSLHIEENKEIASDNVLADKVFSPNKEDSYEQMMKILMDGVTQDDEVTFYDI
jgi:hypothetical protein